MLFGSFVFKISNRYITPVCARTLGAKTNLKQTEQKNRVLCITFDLFYTQTNKSIYYMQNAKELDYKVVEPPENTLQFVRIRSICNKPVTEGVPRRWAGGFILRLSFQ